MTTYQKTQESLGTLFRLSWPSSGLVTRQSSVWANRATHAVLHDSERLDVSPPCGEASWGQRTSIGHEGLTSARSLSFRRFVHGCGCGTKQLRLDVEQKRHGRSCSNITEENGKLFGTI